MNRRHFLGSSVSAAIAAAVPGGAYANSLLHALMTVSSSVVGRSGDGDEVNIEETALEELKGALRGQLLLAGNEGYDTARRVLNRSIDKHPALIVRPSGPADVATAVSCPTVVVSWNVNADPEPHVKYIRSYWDTIARYTDGFYTNQGEKLKRQILNRTEARVQETLGEAPAAK